MKNALCAGTVSKIAKRTENRAYPNWVARYLLWVSVAACSHTPRPYGIPYGSVYCAHACMPAPSPFLAALRSASITPTLADCCKEMR